MSKSRKTYITTSIPFLLTRPSLRYLFEIIIADTIKSFRILCGSETFLSVGTDETSLQIFYESLKLNKEVKELCSEYSQSFKDLNNSFRINYDCFIRTSANDNHKNTVLKVWNQHLRDNFIYKSKYVKKYCKFCDKNTQHALRGDKCTLHNANYEITTEDNYYFRLSEFSNFIRNALEEDQIKIYPDSYSIESINFISKGLNDFSVSRQDSNQWGIQVPNESDQVIYTWYDSLFSYISAIDFLDANQNSLLNYWDDSTEKIQVISKKHLRYHSIIWPALLKGLGLALPNKLVVHGNIITDSDASEEEFINDLKVEFPIESIRFYLLSGSSIFRDKKIDKSRLIDTHNSYLVNKLGNTISRVQSLFELYEIDLRLRNDCEFPKIYSHLMQEFRFDKAIDFIFKMLKDINAMISQSEPWKKQQLMENQQIVDQILSKLSIILHCLEPIIPLSISQIRDSLQKNKREVYFQRLHQV